MVRYLTLIKLTDKGVHEIANSVKRAAAFCNEVKAAGGKVTGQYWAIGHIDGAVVFETPDDDTAAKLLLQLAHGGFVRTQSARLFNAEEFQRIVPK